MAKKEKSKAGNSKKAVFFMTGLALITFVIGFALGMNPFTMQLTGSTISGMTIDEIQNMVAENSLLQKGIDESLSQIDNLKEENTNLKASVLEIINLVFSGPKNEETIEETETTDTTGKTTYGGPHNFETYQSGTETPPTIEEPVTPPAPPIPKHPMVPVDPITPSPPTQEQPVKIDVPLQPAP